MIDEREALAGVRVLVAVAKADGRLDDAERAALGDALTSFGIKLPEGTSPDSLFEETIDVVAEAAKITTPLTRDVVFEAAVAMSLADSRADAREQKVIAQLRSAFGQEALSSPLPSLLDRTTRGGALMSRAQPIQDPARRDAEVTRRIKGTAFIAAVFAALPIPVAGEVLVLIQQTELVGAIATYWGHPLTRAEAWARFGSVFALVVVGSGIQSLAKLVPGWGSAVSAVMTYATTYGLGRAVEYSLRSEGKATDAELRAVFLRAKSEGKAAFASEKASVEASAKDHRAELESLAQKFAKGELSEQEYESRLDALIHREGHGGA